MLIRATTGCAPRWAERRSLFGFIDQRRTGNVTKQAVSGRAPRCLNVHPLGPFHALRTRDDRAQLSSEVEEERRKESPSTACVASVSFLSHRRPGRASVSPIAGKFISFSRLVESEVGEGGDRMGSTGKRP